MKKMDKQGFTLAELLIVVAIIAVLVAISIPVFTSQLESARDSVSISNIRSAYAQAQSAYLTSLGNKSWADKEVGTTGNSVKVTTDANGKVTTVKVANIVIKSEKANEWSGESAQLPFPSGVTVADGGESIADATVTFTYEDEAIKTVTYAATT